MKPIKKMLMGIAIILFGIALLVSNMDNLSLFIGLPVAVIGLIMTFVGYWFTETDED